MRLQAELTRLESAHAAELQALHARTAAEIAMAREQAKQADAAAAAAAAEAASAPASSREKLQARASLCTRTTGLEPLSETTERNH